MNPMLNAIQRRLGGGTGAETPPGGGLIQLGSPKPQNRPFRGLLPGGVQSPSPAQGTLSQFADAIRRRVGG